MNLDEIKREHKPVHGTLGGIPGTVCDKDRQVWGDEGCDAYQLLGALRALGEVCAGCDKLIDECACPYPDQVDAAAARGDLSSSTGKATA